jgi:hypothetical protein
VGKKKVLRHSKEELSIHAWPFLFLNGLPEGLELSETAGADRGLPRHPAAAEKPGFAYYRTIIVSLFEEKAPITRFDARC